jgi:drug/metabolite transporter (DMT)-like permease
LRRAAPLTSAPKENGIEMSSNRALLPLGLLTAVLATSTASIFIRLAQAEAPSLVIAALRLTFASLMLAPWTWRRHGNELRALRRTDLLLAVLSGLFLAGHFALWITSLEYTTVASSVVFVTTGPLWVALVSPLILKETLSRGALAGLALALAGGAVIGAADACTWSTGLDCAPLAAAMGSRAMWGNFLAVAGAWAVSGYLIIGRVLRARTSLLAYIFVVYSSAAIVLIALMGGAGHTPLGYRPAVYGWILLTALVPQVIGHSAYNWALRYLPAALVSTAGLGEPIAAAIMAYLFLGERPALLVVAGGLMILVGIYFSSRGAAAAPVDLPAQRGPHPAERTSTAE